MSRFSSLLPLLMTRVGKAWIDCPHASDSPGPTLSGSYHSPETLASHLLPVPLHLRGGESALVLGVTWPHCHLSIHQRPVKTATIRHIIAVGGSCPPGKNCPLQPNKAVLGATGMDPPRWTVEETWSHQRGGHPRRQQRQAAPAPTSSPARFMCHTKRVSGSRLDAGDLPQFAYFTSVRHW